MGGGMGAPGNRWIGYVMNAQRAYRANEAMSGIYRPLYGGSYGDPQRAASVRQAYAQSLAGMPSLSDFIRKHDPFEDWKITFRQAADGFRREQDATASKRTRITGYLLGACTAFLIVEGFIAYFLP